LEELGLLAVFGNEKELAKRIVDGGGPDGTAGIIVSPPVEHANGKRASLGYYKESQTWKEISNGKYWIGYETENPPRPIDLEREEMVDGHRVELEDGCEWLVPTALSFAHGTSLPQSLVLGPDGEIVTEVVPRFAKLWKKAEWLFEEFRKDWDKNTEGASNVPLQEGWGIAVEALSVNYKISSWEMSILRAFTTTNLTNILKAIIDFPTLIEVSIEHAKASKKKVDASIQDGCDSSNGKQET